jgi:hypothetical protein
MFPQIVINALFMLHFLIATERLRQVSSGCSVDHTITYVFGFLFRQVVKFLLPCRASLFKRWRLRLMNADTVKAATVIIDSICPYFDDFPFREYFLKYLHNPFFLHKEGYIF